MIYTDSSRCGTGKTTSLIKQAKQLLALGQSVLIVQPSIILLNETQDKLPDSKAIHTNNTDNVTKKFYRYATHENNPHIILVTHQAFMQCNFNLNKYHLLLDEEIDPLELFELNLKETSDKLNLNDLYKFVDSKHDGYKLVEAHNLIELQEITESKDDVMYLFNKLNKGIISPHHDVYVTHEMSEKFVNEEGKLIAHILLKPEKFEGFKSIRFYGAQIEQSLLIKVLGLNVKVVKEFEPHDGSKVTLWYADNKGWSKYANLNSPDIKDTFVKFYKNQIGNEKYIFLDNNDQLHRTGDRLSHNVHGINEYRNYTNVVVMSAINPSPTTKKFLIDVCNCTKYDIKKHYMANLYYQTVMRTALRVHGNNKSVRIFCLDGKVAEYLMCEYFGGTINYVIPNTQVKTKPKPLTGAEKTQLLRLRKNYPFLKDKSTYNPRDVLNEEVMQYITNSKLTDIAKEIQKEHNLTDIELFNWLINKTCI